MIKIKGLLSRTRGVINGAYAKQSELTIDRSPNLRPHAMHFQVYNAQGGWVIQHTHYDEKKDDNIARLYVVPDDRDLAETLSKIINFELLRK